MIPDKCACLEPGKCPIMGIEINARQHQYCMGNSGLDRWKEVAYLCQLTGDVAPLAPSDSIRTENLPCDTCIKPSLWQRGQNFTKAWIDHVRQGMPVVSEVIYKQRLSLCLACEHLDKDKICTRPECGCPVERKNWWAEQRCPLDPPKWDVYKQEEQQIVVAPATGGCGCGK